MQPIFTCFTEHLNYALGWMVIHSLWQATVIAILSGITAIMLRQKSPHIRYWVYNIALLSVFLAAVVTFCLYFNFSKEAGQTIFVPENTDTYIVEAAQSEISNPESEAQSPLSMEGLQLYFNRNIYLIVTAWVLGVALFMLKLLGGISYVYYLRSRLNFPADEYWFEIVENLGKKAGIKRPLELVESALVRSPLVVGHLKPMILFPIGAINKLNPQEVEAILAHEIAHILRNDYVFNIIQSVIEALFYFHPAVWWISANIRAERENCCDDVAIALCGNSMTYAKALVSLQEMAFYHTPKMAMAFAGKQKNQLLFRVQRILKQPQNKTNVMEKLIATSLLLVMMVALSFGSTRLNNNTLSNINTPADSQSFNNTIMAKDSHAVHVIVVDLPSKQYIKFENDGVLDSFPIGKDVADGNYNYADNIFQAKLIIKHHAVVKLSINGSEIMDAEIKNHSGIINTIIMQTVPLLERSADGQYGDNIEAHIASTNEQPVSMPQFRESNGGMVVRTDKNGVTTSETLDHNGKRISSTSRSSRTNSNTIVTNDDGASQTISSNGKIETRNADGSRDILNGETGEIIHYDPKGRMTNYLGNGTQKSIVVDDDATPDKEGKYKNSAESPTDLVQLFFLDLVRRGLVSANVNSLVEFNNNYLKINGKMMDNATFHNVKNEFESHLTKKGRYSIAYTGILSNVTSKGLNISGNLSTTIDGN